MSEKIEANFQKESEVREQELGGLFPVIEKDKLDLARSIKLEHETGVLEDKGDYSYWTAVVGENGKVVEGKIFISGEGKKKLLFFEPGMPGDSNKWMEQKFVPQLLREGYSVFCARHRGTKVNAENSSEYVNCPERTNLTQEQDAVLGAVGDKKEFTVKDIAEEPRIVLDTIGKNFEEIFLVGHSNGVGGIASSVGELPKEITDRIVNFVGLSGFVSRYEKDKDLFDAKGVLNSKGVRKYYEAVARAINLGDLDRNVELQKQVLDLIYNSKIPENINIVLVNSPKDEVIPIETPKQFHDFAGRGLRITDESQFEEPFHDLKNLRPETLSRLLKIYHPKRKHTITVRK